MEPGEEFAESFRVLESLPALVASWGVGLWHGGTS
jgi:hypothetical protein